MTGHPRSLISPSEALCLFVVATTIIGLVIFTKGVTGEVTGSIMIICGHCIMGAGTIMKVRSATKLDGNAFGTGLREACIFLEFLSLLVPSRLAEEEIGDALEVIIGLDSKWKTYLKVASTAFWVIINATRDIVSALAGKPAPR